jgi:hypothetical protein
MLPPGSAEPSAREKECAVMKRLVERILKRTPLLQALRKWSATRRQDREVAEWERKGRPNPPPHAIKQQALRHYAAKYGLKVLVETGTYKGKMVEAMKNDFEQIYSIELGKELYLKAKERFKTDRHVELIHGDSGKELGKLVPRIDRPALFWLDGHYSGGETAKGDRDTPIFDELAHILGPHGLGHMIVIDDARLFGAKPAYPSMDELRAFVNSKRQGVEIVVQDDSIRITPRGPA